MKTHAVTWAANMVVQDALPSVYYDYDVNTLGVLSLQHNGRQHGKTDGVCFNTLVALVPEHVRRNEDGDKVEWRSTGLPPGFHFVGVNFLLISHRPAGANNNALLVI